MQRRTVLHMFGDAAGREYAADTPDGVSTAAETEEIDPVAWLPRVKNRA